MGSVSYKMSWNSVKSQFFLLKLEMHCDQHLFSNNYKTTCYLQSLCQKSEDIFEVQRKKTVFLQHTRFILFLIPTFTGNMLIQQSWKPTFLKKKKFQWHLFVIMCVRDCPFTVYFNKWTHAALSTAYFSEDWGSTVSVFTLRSLMIHSLHLH